MKPSSDFQLFGIFGYPLAHTLSPAMQEAAFSAAGIHAYYLVFEMSVPHFKKAMQGLGRFQLDGFNITVPYKETVIPYLDGLTAEARAVGAVNTVFKKGKKWIGANTDVYGFVTALKNEGTFLPRGKNVVVFGAGGAARAAVYGLASAGAREIHLLNRHKERAEKIIRDFKKIFPKTILTVSEKLRKSLENADLVVNATSVGLKSGDPKLIEDSWIPSASGNRRKLFFDLIYHRAETPFLKAAKKKGHRVLSGVEMLVQQGAKAFEYWTGRKAPVDIMRRTLKQGLKSKS